MTKSSYDELVKQCRDCIDCLCSECKYEYLQKPGNFVQCMNALLGEAADAIEELKANKTQYAEESFPKFNKDHFNISYLELAKQDNNESQSHLCNSLNSMYGLFMRLGSTNDGTYIPVKASTLYTAGLYFERAQNLITYLQNELNLA